MSANIFFMHTPFALPFTRLLAAIALCLVAPQLRAQTVNASADDTAKLKSLISAVDAWDARDKARFDSDLAAQVEKSWRSIRDPFVRIKTRELIPDLERAAVLRARLQEIAAATKAAKGTAVFESGAPQWLRDLLGDDSLHVLDRLTAVDINDRGNPH